MWLPNQHHRFFLVEFVVFPISNALPDKQRSLNFGGFIICTEHQYLMIAAIPQKK
jgi:hypothetical protein